MSPDIEGKIYNFLYFKDSGAEGALYQSNSFGSDVGLPPGSTTWGSIALKASKSNAVHGKSPTVQTNALRLLAIIKH